MALLFRLSPRRRQPAWSWLAFGVGAVGGALVAVTLALGLMFRRQHARSATRTARSPGIVALQIWALLSSISILYGAAVAAQLEAVRAGVPGPQRSGRRPQRPPPTDEDLLVPATVPDVSVLGA